MGGIASLPHCREAVVPGSHAAIIKVIVREVNAPGRQATLMGLNLLAAVSARECSQQESDALLEVAGLYRTAARHTALAQRVIEAAAGSDGGQGSQPDSEA
jgi:hypothetical protein